jgi:hypothetical protein
MSTAYDCFLSYASQDLRDCPTRMKELADSLLAIKPERIGNGKCREHADREETRHVRLVAMLPVRSTCPMARALEVSHERAISNLPVICP